MKKALLKNEQDILKMLHIPVSGTGIIYIFSYYDFKNSEEVVVKLDVELNVFLK